MRNVNYAEALSESFRTNGWLKVPVVVNILRDIIIFSDRYLLAEYFCCVAANVGDNIFLIITFAM